MPSGICINLYSESQVKIETINFLETASWDTDAEKEFMMRLQDLLNIARTQAHTFNIEINMQVVNYNEAVFAIKRKMNKKIEINNQKLSIREIEVLGLIMQGLTNNEIAQKLHISYETVKSHRKNILEKSGAKNTAALINHYHQTFFDK